MLKKILKWTGIILGGLLVLLVIIGLLIHESRPEGETGPAADDLAEAMLDAINYPAWDTTGYISWDFAGMHSYRWDRKRHWVEVSWKDNRVLLDTKAVDGLAYEGGEPVSGKKGDKLIQRAWSFFCNDSFWLHAPAKCFDPGTERAIVEMEDGSENLLVSYTSGGVTPGDAYLWILDADKRPVAWKMWVKIIPVGGLEFSWEGWQKLPTGAELATRHSSPVATLEMTNIEAAADIRDVFPAEDPFQALADSKK